MRVLGGLQLPFAALEIAPRDEFAVFLVPQAIANGLAMGGLYILIALGLTLLLSIMKILQLAHGEVYMIGAYVVYYLAVSFGCNRALVRPLALTHLNKGKLVYSDYIMP